MALDAVCLCSSHRGWLLSFLLLGATLLPARAQSVFETESGHVTFRSEVPTHTFTGESDQLVGRINLEESTVDFYVDVHTIETGIARRDRDMLETLEAEEYPFAEFYGTLNDEVDLNRREPQPVTVTGDFTVHGVTQEMSIDGVIEPVEQGLRVEANWTVRLDDHNIEPPGILFYRVDEEQDVSIEATLMPVDEPS